MKISRCLSVLVLAALAAFDPAFAGADKPAAEDGEVKPAAEAEEAKPKSVRKPKKKCHSDMKEKKHEHRKYYYHRPRRCYR